MKPLALVPTPFLRLTAAVSHVQSAIMTGFNGVCGEGKKCWPIGWRLVR